MYSLNYYVPEADHERIKYALFSCGAGKMGLYEHCCWEVKGQGQFRALAGSQPYIGHIGELEQIIEYKVEMICEDKKIKDVVEVLLKEHPYEQPAYFVCKVLTLKNLPDYP